MKIDAPSGFSLALANSLAGQKQFTRNSTEKENLPETRGGNVNGVTVHSVRLPGRSAHHEVVFGAAGQTVTIRHDTLGRDCYMPGVVRCIREANARPGLVVGWRRCWVCRACPAGILRLEFDRRLSDIVIRWNS